MHTHATVLLMCGPGIFLLFVLHTAILVYYPHNIWSMISNPDFLKTQLETKCILKQSKYKNPSRIFILVFPYFTSSVLYD